MTWQDYLEQLDDSHPMTTAKKHIGMLCSEIAGLSWRILELGSHAGHSAAAMALAAPQATITAVDLCDTVPEQARMNLWAGLGIQNIRPMSCSAGEFLGSCQQGQFDLIFHDAVHGMGAYLEYLKCVEIASTVAIHDFEQLPGDMRRSITLKFSRVVEDTDHKGRVLFLGSK